MGKHLGKVGYVDISFEKEMDRVKNKLEKIGLDGISDRQASKVIAEMISSTDYKIERKNRKRKKQLIISL